MKINSFIMEKLFYSLKEYWDLASFNPLTICLIISTIVLIPLISLVLFIFLKNEKKITFLLYRNLILGNFLILFLLIILEISVINFSNEINSNHLQLPFIIATILVCIFLIFLFYNFKSKFKFNNNQILGISIGNIEKNKRSKLFIQDYNYLKKILIIIFIPFLLLLLKPKEKWLVSLIIDNSESMDEKLIYGIQSFNSALTKVEKQADFVLTQFPNGSNAEDCIKIVSKEKNNILNIIKQNKSDSLVSQTIILYGKETLLTYLNSKNINISLTLSPIYEAIWQNFIISTKQAKDIYYYKKKFILISDGQDLNLYKNTNKLGVDIFKSKLDNIAPVNFYDQIDFINLGGDENKYLFADCKDYKINDGRNAESYYQALNEILEDLKIDYLFIIIIGIIITITSIIILLIKPK